MKSKRGRYLTSVSIGAATVWFSTHCGAGFASGTQETAYFVASGWLAPFMTIISQVLMGLIVWVGCESARLYNTFTYGDLSRKIYAPHEKILAAAYELMAPISAIMAEYKGRVDGKAVSAAVKARLQQAR